MAKKTLSRTWTQEVPIDGVPVSLQFKRMTVEQFIEWERQYMSYRKPPVGAEALDENDPVVIERGKETLAWVKDTLATHVSLAEDELEIDGVPVRSGDDLYKAYGTDLTTMFAIVNHIWLFHRFDGPSRKNLLSLSASLTTSGVPEPVAVGPRPDRTAGSVEHAGFVTTGAVAPAGAPTAELSGAMA